MNAVTSEATPLWLISANDLLSGEVVYLADQAEWTRELAQAVCIDNEQAAEQARQSAELQHDKIVGPIVVGATYHAGENKLMLNHFRDRFRDSGPTHRSELARVASPEHALQGYVAAQITSHATGVA